MEKRINKVAVLGSGVMGSQIAAHFANAGIRTVLFGLSADQDHRDSAAYAITHLNQLKPPPVASSEALRYLSAASYDDGCEHLASCDLLIEAVSEEMEIKRDLYQRIAPYLNQDSIIASNTSGLSIEALSLVLQSASSSNLQAGFCGVHFFNPPRYMPLVELIASTQTAPATLDMLEDWLTTRLGKHIVRAKDKPGFIANRCGVFALMSALRHGERLGFAPDLIDELTGELIYRPKSATFRTLDLVGLDILIKLVRNLHNTLTDDPWREYFVLPKWITNLAEQGHLGQKTGGGVYRKRDDSIEVFDAAKGIYRPRRKALDDSVKAIMNMEEQQQLQALSESEHPQADFLYAIKRDLFHYAAYHVQSISHNLRDIDFAMRWGYGWRRGIFEQWQRIGWQQGVRQIDNDIAAGKCIEAELPEWAMDKERTAVFNQTGAWSPELHEYSPRDQGAIYQRQIGAPELYGESCTVGTTISENESAKIWHRDEQLIISFKTKMHSLSYDLILQLDQAITLAEARYKGLIIWHQEPPFCAGANLLEILLAAKVGKIVRNKITSRIKEASLRLMKPELPDISELPPVDKMIRYLQRTFMRLRNCRVPTIAAVQGMVLGGGCEMLLHCDRVVASLESYIGLVEIGVGVLPAGGGCKEMAARAVNDAKGGDLFPPISRYYEQIAKAEVSSSAVKAREMGYLREADVIVMNSYELLYVAMQQVNAMDASIYRPPHPEQYLKAAGTTASANFYVHLTNLREGGYISEYDYHIAGKISEVICGVPLSKGEQVSAQWYLDREREAFTDLLKQKKTQERIEYMLKKGKPLRN